ncbi:leucine-rich repeat domain-containing protein (plasmid) [Paracoccus sp. T5]
MAFAKAQEKIAKAARTGEKELHFGRDDFPALDRLPPEIENLSGLQTITLDDTQVADLAPLAGLKGLQSLILLNTRVTNLAPLAGLTSLQILNLSGTQITDLAPLWGLKGLQILNLGRTPITDFAPLASLTGLQILTLDSTPITDLAPLAGLEGLQNLNLNDTRITDFTSLASLKGLTTLQLYDTSITDLTPLAGLKGLTTLQLYDTPITDLAPLTDLKSLKTLNLDDARIADLRPIAELDKLGTDRSNGLTFQNTPATQRDAQLAELAQIKDDNERTRKTLNYLRSLPPWPEPYAPYATPDGGSSQPIGGAVDPPKVKTAKAQIRHLLHYPALTRLTAQKFAGQIRTALRDVPATSGNYLAEPLQTMLEFAEALEHLAPASEPATDPLEQAKLELQIVQLEALVRRLTQQLQDETKAREVAEALAGKGEFGRSFKKAAGLATGTAAIGVVTVGVPAAAVYFLGNEHLLIQSFLTVLGRLPK